MKQILEAPTVGDTQLEDVPVLCYWMAGFIVTGKRAGRWCTRVLGIINASLHRVIVDNQMSYVTKVMVEINTENKTL